MTPRKFRVAFATFHYGGNGLCETLLPGLSDWLRETAFKCQTDDRVEMLGWAKYTDTPITMTRNAAVRDARKSGFDILCMFDNDNLPDCELKFGDPYAKPWWDTSFDFLDKHYDKGPCIIMAPYCGAPPIECPFGFTWKNHEHDTPEVKFQLKMYEREHASILGGIQNVAAGPTGVIMFDLRAFDLIPHPYFDYEWTDETHSEKASTEDVFTTRNIALAGIEKLGYNPLYMNWDAWAGHSKPKMVRKPRPITSEQVHKSLADAVRAGHRGDERLIEVSHSPTLGKQFWETGLPSLCAGDGMQSLGTETVSRGEPFRPIITETDTMACGNG